MSKLQVLKISLLSSVLASPVPVLMIFLGFDGSKKNVLTIISFVSVSVLIFSVCCVFAYPVLKWEDRVISGANPYVGAITGTAHAIIYYPVSLYFIKILYSYQNKITTDSTFGMLVIHSIISFYVLFLLSLISEQLEK